MEQRYSFLHRLTADAAQQALLRSNRQLLHSAAADALTEMLVKGTAQEPQLLCELLRHLEAAGRWSDAHRRACELVELHNLEREHIPGAFLVQAVLSWQEAHPEEPATWPASADALLAMEPGELPPSAGLLSAVGNLHMMQNRLAIAEGYLLRSRQLAHEQGELAAASQAALQLAQLYYDEGRMDEIAACCQEALAGAMALKDPLLEAMAELRLGTLAESRGELEESLQRYRRALELRRAAGNRSGVALTLGYIASIRLLQGFPLESMQLSIEARDIVRSLDDRSGESYLTNGVGVAQRGMGQLAAAEESFRHALSLVLELGDHYGEAFMRANLGMIRLLRGALDPARRQFQQALVLHRQLGTKRGIAAALLGLAQLARLDGDLLSASEQLAESEQAFRELEDPPGLSQALLLRGQIAEELGDMAAATLAWDEAAQLAAAGEARVEQAQALAHLAQLAARAGTSKLSVERETRALIGKVPPQTEAQVRCLLAEAALARGARGDAAEELETAQLIVTFLELLPTAELQRQCARVSVAVNAAG